MLHDLLIVLFAITIGFTASGIAANSYRLVAGKPESTGAKVVYAAVMIFAGPIVLFGNAARSFRKKDCSRVAFWLAAAVAGYWSFALGLFMLSLSIAH